MLTDTIAYYRSHCVLIQCQSSLFKKVLYFNTVFSLYKLVKHMLTKNSENQFSWSRFISRSFSSTRLVGDRLDYIVIKSPYRFPNLHFTCEVADICIVYWWTLVLMYDRFSRAWPSGSSNGLMIFENFVVTFDFLTHFWFSEKGSKKLKNSNFWHFFF